MRKSIKLAALGVAGAGAIAGAIAGIRWFRARRADDSIDIDLSVDDLDAVDFGEPVVVAEEIVVVTEPVTIT
ncbi:MAG TPA: hypothetical protein VL326_25630 [Kofleriaceae bacterium]|jgi:hypothetical protein|nr:hypothetical protein [Kofleriaceae bacterium]